jgi:transcriptional regulator with XRE-family HTH domain
MPKIIKEVEDTKGLYNRIEAQRRYLGVTQEDLANAVGINVRTYQNWMRSGTTEKNIDRLGNALKKWGKG